MENLELINEENISRMFNIREILAGSVLYPASGTDYADIEYLTSQYRSFVHIDYTVPESTVSEAMRFKVKAEAGYELVAMMRVPMEMLASSGMRWSPQLNHHEKNRLKIDFIRNAFHGVGFTPFALWGVYERILPPTGPHAAKVSRIALLHIGGEACATLETLYYTQRVNPAAVLVIAPSEGYGNNWTMFTAPGFRFYQTLKRNHVRQGVDMPSLLVTDLGYEPCFWPEYGKKTFLAPRRDIRHELFTYTLL